MTKKKKKYIIFLTIVALAIIFCIWQNNDIVVSKYEIVNGKMEKSFDGYKIVQISDLHNKEFGANQKRLLHVVSEQEPDIIVITGDLIDSSHTNVEIAMEFINGAVGIAPVYFVTGNHERWSAGYEKLKEKMKDAGVLVLDNEVKNIVNEKGDVFHLVGLDDSSLTDGTLEKQLDMYDDNKYSILLAHEPQYIDYYSSTNVDLVLSGHAHGGQVRLPFIKGMVAPGQGFFPKYTSGIYKSNNTSMVVSRGLGNSIIPLRIFNRPEVVTIILRDKK